MWVGEPKVSHIVTQPTVGEVLGHLIRSRRAFIENLIPIEDKQRQILRFTPNPIQDDVLDWLEPPGGRHIALKPSQVGFSSVVIAFFLADTICVPGTTSVIVAHEEFITQRLLTKAQFYYDQLPAEFKPRMSHRSANEKFFPDLNSVLYIGSARAHVFGRGEPIHNFLADEYAFWPDPERIMVPALQRVPPWGRCIVGSTPNGEDNAFHDLYEQAKTGRSIWQPHFYPWYQHPEYTLPTGHPLAKTEDRGQIQALDSEEESLLRRGVTEGQLRWRRAKISELEALRRDGQTRLMFGQEFPEDDETCFLAAGDMVHDPSLLDKLARACFPAQYSHEGAQIWEPPVPGRQYIMAIDPGQGKFTESAVTVWRSEPNWKVSENPDLPPEPLPDKLIHCATLCGHWDPEITARYADSLGRYYLGAMAVPEANSHGIAIITELKNVHRYPQIYLRENPITHGVSANDYGWLTTPRTKPFMVKEFSKHLAYMECADAKIISQARNVRYAATGRQDIYVHLGLSDLYMSACIAVVCHSSLPVARGFAGTAGWKPGWGQAGGKVISQRRV